MYWRCICLPLAGLLALWTVLGTAAPAVAQTSAEPTSPATSQVSGEATDSAWPPNDWLGRVVAMPSKWLVDALTGALISIGRTLLEAIQRDVDWAFGTDGHGAGFVTRTPPEYSYESPSVEALFNTVRLVANVALAMVVMWAGYQVMSGSQFRGVASVHSAMEFAPRLVVGALLVNTSLWWGQLAVDGANALSSLADPITLPGISAASDPPMVLELVLVAFVYWLVALLLVVQELMRLALVDALLVLAPLGMLLWILPQTQSWGRLWSDLFLATVFAQPAQMLVLKLGSLLVNELGSGGPLVSMFLAMGVAYLTLKVPAMIRSGLIRGGASMDLSVFAAAAGARQMSRAASVGRS
jgi:hypothetical protein